ncbi:hypothetical protein GGS21DRAFT_314838 [Xylaria nigripes]|nr:hypothetical protein GGS21DRAFT_314838 [Xylaria nigripes]
MDTSADDLEYIFHHLFLPSGLPQENDYASKRENNLLSAVIDGLVAWKSCIKSSHHGQADTAISMLRKMQQVHSISDGSLIETEVLRLLKQLAEGDAIPLYIREQNAGVLISRHGNHVFFEVFEICSTNVAIMTTKGRLRRSFPGAAVALGASQFQQRKLQETIAHTLAEMSKYAIEAMLPKVKKADSVMPELRDTTHPGMVSELFIGFLRSIGEPVECPAIIKNIRDDVLWHNSYLPWRRSPSWLLVRVALQLEFSRKSIPAKSDTVYKEAMLFILRHILVLATKLSLSSHVLFSMNAKLARRLLKRGQAIDDKLGLYVRKAMQDSHAIISNRWSVIQKRDPLKINLSQLSDLDFVNDSHVSLPDLDQHIIWMNCREQELIFSEFQPTSALIALSSKDLPRLQSYSFGEGTDYAITNLEAFETWVALHCQEWSQNNQQMACREIGSLISEYHKLASSNYLKNPEALSTMVLTILELWVALDVATVSLCPLLGQYRPGVPLDLLQNLLLPFVSQMRRLRHVENYLVLRSWATFTPTQLYYSLDSQECFPVKFYDTSVEMQEKLQEITADARKKKQAKLAELGSLKAEYTRLQMLAGQMPCEYEVVFDDIDMDEGWRHKPSCQKCKLKAQAANLRINIHEWPLPKNDLKAKAVVFELCILPCFQSWRQATFYLLQDVLGMQYSLENSPRSRHELSSDPHLHSSSSLESNIGLLSEDKPQVVTHRRVLLVSTATENSVCVNNGLNYRYFDFSKNTFVESFVPTEKVLEMCTYHLPTRSKGLQKYLFRPKSSPDGPDPNVALADQSEIPIHMGVEEGRDLAMLPLGHHIQLYNILVQLAAPSLDFKKEETAIFILQCLYQAGPPGSTILRAGHDIADDERFAFRLLENVRIAWQRVKDNWESAHALRVFAAITTRLLSLTSSEKVTESCFNLLSTLRAGAFAWIELLRNKSYTATTQDDVAFFKSKSIDIALICSSCFDVEQGHLSRILESDANASIFVQCSILIQEGNCEYSSVSELPFACLHLRFQRLLYRSSPILSATHSGISDAVKKAWSAYRPVGGWRLVCNSTHWLVTETASDNGLPHLKVHFNLLSGELLVNGLPLSRPPAAYEASPLWKTLFGRAAMEVMPTSAAGMQFSIKREYKGYIIFLGLNSTSSKGSDLVVQASNSTARYEIIPARQFQEIFPDRFVKDFVHWYNYMEHTIEFRPLATPWNSSDSTWILSRSDVGWILKRRGSAVLGMKSKSATAVADILSPLADKLDIHLFLQPSDRPLLEVEIPTLRFGFFLASGESSLRSREFPGMVVDGDQSLGTLVGFTNKLILRDHDCRLLLVPEGPVSWRPVDDHTKVEISKTSIVKIHALHIDSVLGRLIDNGNLQGKLFVSYLHALTSYYLPDPLTKTTGVEQALLILNSAAVRSFDRLSQQNIDILVKIARLNPIRQYYPQHERVMQTISWTSNLNYLSQHDGFFKAVSIIFEQAKQMSLFYPESGSEELDIRKMIPTSDFLMERDCIRSSTFRISEFGSEAHTTIHDVTYPSRDQNQRSDRGTNAYILSRILYAQHTTLHTAAPQGGKLWTILATSPSVEGPNGGLSLSQLKYSADAANSGLDLSLWLQLHQILASRAVVAHRFSIMIWLSTIAAHEGADLALLQVLALFFTTEELIDIELPMIQSCNPSKGYQANMGVLKSSVDSHCSVPFRSSPEARLPANPGESESDSHSRRHSQYQSKKNDAVTTLVSEIYKQWPRETLPALGHVDRTISDYIMISKVQSTVSKLFEEWFNNLLLFKYLQRIETALFVLSLVPLDYYRPKVMTLTPPTRSRTFVSVQDIFAGAAPSLPMIVATLKLVPFAGKYTQQNPRLEGLLGDLKKTALRSQYGLSYIKELQKSMASLQGQESEADLDLRKHHVASLRQHLDDCKRVVDDIYLQLIKVDVVRTCMSELGHGPRISPLLFLRRLSNEAWEHLGQDWKESVVQFGLALSVLQKAERLVRTATSLQSNDDLLKELNNVGHQNWDPIEHPEWLLLEIESGIIIRDVQKLIASEMIYPHSRRNSTMQLNMGEGKSSVIVPMVAAELANRSQLVRVIVAKPQSKQMAQMLTSKLGGLLGRKVYHMPFSRALNIKSAETARVIEKMLKDCKDSGGVLLLQPEHILSFQLMGLERYNDINIENTAVGKAVIQIQDFLDNNSRDIVDESDENFSPKFELIYTIGSQRPIELSPSRWICIQQVLGLVRSVATDITVQLPNSMELHSRHDGRFPRLRVLKADAGKLLVEQVARCIYLQGLDGFPVARQKMRVRMAISKYITQYSLTRDEISAVEESGDGGFWTESTKPLLFLLRGLLAGGVLLFALSQKRWRVNFGLATTRIPRTQLAVPYRAKDSPTPRSEFSHPDVVIVLTCLAYYYDGLEDEDLFITLGHLMKSDQASVEYDAWIKDSPHMPTSFRQLEGINLKDRPQCIKDVFPHLKYGKSVIDYFLGHIVFPKEVKEFPHKLSASGWDIGKEKVHYTTGFSGTNDSRGLLPIDVEHLDLPSQSHTNALVLEYLLQPENSVKLLPDRPDASGTDAKHFLETVVTLETPTRVILDVGAQILELSNQQVAESWLQLVPDTQTQAAVFINDEDELSVVDRRGSLELLQTSSYATRLDCCLVFLDEAHTRGIDLKLPSNYRAAVTLGANLTKDRLVQACMRMRKLGRGQSVVFCVGAEIRAKIQELTAKPAGAAIEVRDVLHWAISETFAEIKRALPLWAVQGDRFLRQEELWKSTQVDGITSMSHTHAKLFLEDEAQTLEARYRPSPEVGISISDILHSGSQRSSEIIDRCNKFEDLHLKSSTLEEEQERELSPEIEREHQVQRPAPAWPVDHFLHFDVVSFVQTGRLVPTSSAYMQAFHALRNTTASEVFDVSQLSSPNLFVTLDFVDTIEMSHFNDTFDSYQRPVQWVLSSRVSGTNVIDVLLIISPYEAEKLLPELESVFSSNVTLHLYKPRSHTIHYAFDNLDFFTIPYQQKPLELPRSLLVQLNLFAGQLYFHTYEDYLETCEFLGLAAHLPKSGESIAPDGYILSDSNGKSKYDKSPVKIFQILTSQIRRNGQGISKTHVGGMLDGKLLRRSDIEG